ncbi:discoidin domain-containing protein [Streptosporangium sp. NBC_01810]|uniref:discoidin domain-containing protein n=1 Tax=Streptosporangium sp. NBC_01810 TaxID=2975951 RepID=UPI002DDA8805|nr:discoidin domain-containing protein [Streptosporangium sp. NBC_01810]WSA23986.1 discoidin domain-containing protein [Streptosporangium sp. NBC_01810]
MHARPRLQRPSTVLVLALASALIASVFVLAAPPGFAADSLLSQGRPATSSSNEDATFLPSAAFDGNTTTRWASAEGHDSGIGRYVRMYGTAHGYSLYEMEVYGSTGGTTPSPTPTITPGGPGVPFGSHAIPYAAGILRPSGAQATLDQKVIDYYQRWKAAFVKQNCGNGWYQIISPDADHPYVAEAQGYGMVITATMAGADPDAKKIFDGLVKYVLAHPSSITPGLLAAEQNTACQSVNGGDSATDGDLVVTSGDAKSLAAARKLNTWIKSKPVRSARASPTEITPRTTSARFNPGRRGMELHRKPHVA